MRNKIIFILIFLFVFLINTSFAFTDDEVLSYIQQALDEGPSTGRVIGNTINLPVTGSPIEDYDDFFAIWDFTSLNVHLVLVDQDVLDNSIKFTSNSSDTGFRLWYNSEDEVFPRSVNDSNSSYIQTVCINMVSSYTRNNFSFNSASYSFSYPWPGSWKSSTSGSPGYNYYINFGQHASDTFDKSHDYIYVSTLNIYDSYSDDVFLPANVGDIGPTFPEIIINSSSYTESNSNIPVTIFANNYYDAISGGTPVDLNYYLRLTVYDLNGLEQYYRNFYQDFDGLYNNGNIFSAENYSSASDSWALDFKEYFDFIFSNNLKYKLSLIDYDGNILDETDFFKVNFSDDFNPSTGSSYDITPTITALPLSASAQKTVTITSPVDNAVIYYKLDSGNPWQFYSDPVTVTENCKVYALLYGPDGSSATAQLDITNIANMTNFENRPNISPKINSRVEERNGDFYALFYIPSEFLEKYDISEWKLQWNINNSYWSDYPSGYDDRKGSARYYYEFTPEFPSVFSFRFVDENGFYSPSCTFTLNKNSNIPIVVGGTEGDAYDSNGNYDESKTDNNSMPSFIANAETPGEYVAAGTVYIVNLFSNIGGFFALVSSLFSFLPPIIIQILMTFLYVTFAIFVITIIKGIL